MSRILLLVVGVALLLVIAIGGYLGAFPPSPRTEQIQRVLPNDKFSPSR